MPENQKKDRLTMGFGLGCVVIIATAALVYFGAKPMQLGGKVYDAFVSLPLSAPILLCAALAATGRPRTALGVLLAIVAEVVIVPLLLISYYGLPSFLPTR